MARLQATEVLYDIATRHSLDAAKLAAFVAEDKQDGWRGGSEFLGSVWVEEGQVLYALVRYTRPTLVYEFGTSVGGSTGHIAAALKKNRKGKLITLDIEPNAGENVDKALYKQVEFVTADAWLYNLEPCNFVFEDASHTAGLVECVARKARAALTPGGFCLHHDALQSAVGEGVRAGLKAAEVDFVIHATGAEGGWGRTGLAVWRKGEK